MKNQNLMIFFMVKKKKKKKFKFPKINIDELLNEEIFEETYIETSNTVLIKDQISKSFIKTLNKNNYLK